MVIAANFHMEEHGSTSVVDVLTEAIGTIPWCRHPPSESEIHGHLLHSVANLNVHQGSDSVLTLMKLLTARLVPRGAFIKQLNSAAATGVLERTLANKFTKNTNRQVSEFNLVLLLATAMIDVEEDEKIPSPVATEKSSKGVLCMEGFRATIDEIMLIVANKWDETLIMKPFLAYLDSQQISPMELRRHAGELKRLLGSTQESQRSVFDQAAWLHALKEHGLHEIDFV